MLKDQSVKHGHIVYNIVVNDCCQHLGLEVVYDLLNCMVHHNFIPDACKYTSLIYAFCRHRYLKEALGVFGIMFDNGISPNTVTCTILLDCFGKKGRSVKPSYSWIKFAILIVFPTFVRTELLSMMKGQQFQYKGAMFMVTSFTVLLVCNVKAWKLQDAFRLYHKMLHEGTKPNIYAYTSLVNDLCHDDKLPEAVTLFKHMVEEGLTPDRIL